MFPQASKITTLAFISLLSSLTLLTTDDYYLRKAQSYQREAEYYQKKADSYRHEAEYYHKKAANY